MGHQKKKDLPDPLPDPPPDLPEGTKLSPGVARRVKLSLELERALADSIPEIAAAHEELVAEVLAPGERMPDLATSLDCYRRVMAAMREGLVAAELAHQAGLDKEAGLRGERDRRFVAVGKNLSRARSVCLGWLGSQGLEPCGLPSAVARGSAVVEQAKEALRLLRAYQPETSDGRDFTKWAAMLAEEIEPELRALPTITAALDKLRSGARAHFDARQQAMTTFDERYLSIGRLAEATLRLAGKIEEADLIHPSTRKLACKEDE